MTRVRRTLVLAAVLALVAAPSAGGYGHLGEQVGSQVLPQHWPSSLLPINLTVDGGPTNLLTEVNTAMTTWNNVGTAQNVFGTAALSPDDFTKASYLTNWGKLNGDGKQEVVVDEDGSILRDFDLAPASINGFGLSGGVIHSGQAEIQDMFLLINGSRLNFDRQATELHELGHTLGLAHSTVGFPIGKDGALSPELEFGVPTMHPFSIASNDRQSLEADDEAALSELYPAGGFPGSLGTITGTDTRCTGEPVLGANVRAINVADPTIQLSRVTGFDGATDGSYTIQGVPSGTYDLVVEPLGGDQQYVDSLALFTRVDADFTQEYFNQTTEADCVQDADQTAPEDFGVGAAGTKVADFKVESASLALVVDITASMGPDIGAVKLGLDSMISGLEATGATFPKTAIVTFDDASHLVLVSRDPVKLRDAVNDLAGTTHTADCPEGSNRALLTAGRLLGTGGRAILITDADSHRTGPTREAVEDFYRSKGARLTTLLSGSCPPEQNPPLTRRPTALTIPPPIPGATPDEDAPVEQLGVENAVRTFSEESLFTGGLFSFQPEIKTVGAPADVAQRYANTLANFGISAVRPAVGAVSPATVPRGNGLDVELTGSNTGFRASSTVAVSGTGVTVSAVRVQSPTRIVVHLAAAAAAPLGFRDVTVSTNRGDGTIETAKGLGAVEVVAPPGAPTILSVTPSAGAIGTTENVTISGGATHFAAGNAANFGTGVTVNHLTVTSPTSAVANVTVTAGATLGFHDVTLGGVTDPSLQGPFLVTAPAPPFPRLASASPAVGERGATVDVTLTGTSTAFANGTSRASISGTGVQVLSTTVSSPTRAVARLKIAANAPLGFRDLEVTTGTHDAALLNGFEIRPHVVPPPPPTTCSDTARPASALLKGNKGARVKKRKLALHGRASDTGCLADIPVAGKVARVDVAISRKAGKKCRFVARSGKLTPARKCSKAVFLKANGTTSWTLSVKRKLPRGRYTVLARATDAAGNRQGTPAQRTIRVR
jgi:hypothetical protein